MAPKILKEASKQVAKVKAKGKSQPKLYTCPSCKFKFPHGDMRKSERPDHIMIKEEPDEKDEYMWICFNCEAQFQRDECPEPATRNLWYTSSGSDVHVAKTGEVSAMKIYYLHRCGCYFHPLLWHAGSASSSDKLRWFCHLDWDRLQQIFPREWSYAISKHPNLRELFIDTCGVKYRPFRDGASLLVQLLVDNEWALFVSEQLPEHILDRFQQVQAEWCELLHSDRPWAKDIKARIMENAIKPSIQAAITDYDLKVVGKLPLREFYESGGKAVTAVDWIKYFREVSRMQDTPGLRMLSKVREKFLIKCEQNQEKE